MSVITSSLFKYKGICLHMDNIELWICFKNVIVTFILIIFVFWSGPWLQISLWYFLNIALEVLLTAFTIEHLTNSGKILLYESTFLGFMHICVSIIPWNAVLNIAWCKKHALYTGKKLPKTNLITFFFPLSLYFFPTFSVSQPEETMFSPVLLPSRGRLERACVAMDSRIGNAAWNFL